MKTRIWRMPGVYQMEINIRYANANDAESLGLVYSQSYQTAFRGIIPDNILDDVFSYEKRRDGLRIELSEGKLLNVVMHKEDKPIGFLTYGKSKDENLDSSVIELLRLYILPSYWGQNIGSQLMSWGIKELQQKGYSKIRLWVIEENKRAIKLYERMGFVHDGVTRIINVGKEIKDLRYIKNI
jgi:ribosomal protein S18 acetylase RimI-like enzyme